MFLSRHLLFFLSLTGLRPDDDDDDDDDDSMRLKSFRSSSSIALCPLSSSSSRPPSSWFLRRWSLFLKTRDFPTLKERKDVSLSLSPDLQKVETLDDGALKERRRPIDDQNGLETNTKDGKRDDFFSRRRRRRRRRKKRMRRPDETLCSYGRSKQPL